MLVDPFFVAALVIVAVLVPVAWVMWERRGTTDGVRLGLVRSALAIVTSVLVLAATLGLINQHYSYIQNAGALVGHVSPDLGHKRRLLAADAVTHGVVVKDSLGGIGFSPKPLYVYLPAAYFDARNATTRFPVLYLLHGSPGVAVDWIRTGHIDITMDSLLDRKLIHPFIIVMPDFDLGYARDTQCEDIPDGPQMQTYLSHGVIDYVDTHYRTLADRRHRIIGGFSAGAYCGINIVMRHQNVFSAFVSQCGYTVPDTNAYTRDLWGGNRWLRRENTPADYLPWIPIERPLGAYIEAGSADRGFRKASEFVAATLRERGADVNFRLVGGHDHTWADARANSPYVLGFASSWFFPPNAPIRRTPSVSRSWRKPERI